MEFDFEANCKLLFNCVLFQWLDFEANCCESINELPGVAWHLDLVIWPITLRPLLCGLHLQSANYHPAIKDNTHVWRFQRGHLKLRTSRIIAFLIRIAFQYRGIRNGSFILPISSPSLLLYCTWHYHLKAVAPRSGNGDGYSMTSDYFRHSSLLLQLFKLRLESGNLYRLLHFSHTHCCLPRPYILSSNSMVNNCHTYIFKLFAYTSSSRFIKVIIKADILCAILAIVSLRNNLTLFCELYITSDMSVIKMVHIQ